MSMTPEEFKNFWDEALKKDPPKTPEERAWWDNYFAEQKKNPPRQATPEQEKIWQAWGESEVRRIAREKGVDLD
ncbi:hypothetical protein FMUAM8_09150 [Nocardia cyriacigeorgica]|nr:hypothetical protein FMUAM8_09150 [Nocardia cyriacigeorgica]